MTSRRGYIVLVMKLKFVQYQKILACNVFGIGSSPFIVITIFILLQLLHDSDLFPTLGLFLPIIGSIGYAARAMSIWHLRANVEPANNNHA